MADDHVRFDVVTTGELTDDAIEALAALLLTSLSATETEQTLTSVCPGNIRGSSTQEASHEQSK